MTDHATRARELQDELEKKAADVVDRFCAYRSPSMTPLKRAILTEFIAAALDQAAQEAVTVEREAVKK